MGTYGGMLLVDRDVYRLNPVCESDLGSQRGALVPSQSWQPVSPASQHVMDEFGNWTLTLTGGMHPLLEDSPKTPLCFHTESPRGDLEICVR